MHSCFVRTCLFISLGVASLHSQNSYEINGTVRDSANRQPLISANLQIVGTSIGSLTDRQGKYLMSRIPAGHHQLKITYLGYATQILDVDLTSGSIERDIVLSASSLEFGGIDIYGIREGQAQALNIQKNADNQQVITSSETIKLFPDPNISEALQRMPGVAILRDQGEGRYVFLRGLEPKYTSVKINGQPVASPEGDIRQVSLDVISSNIVSRIEVSKTITPEMDADAIAGVINMVTKNALDFDKTTWQVSAGSGQNFLENKPLASADITFGTRLGREKQFGLFINAMGYYTHRNSDDLERVWGKRSYLGKSFYVMNEIELRDYNAERKRLSINGALDYRFSEKSSIHLGGIHNYYRDDEIRRRLRIKPSEGKWKFISDSAATIDSIAVERETKDWALTRSLSSAQLLGNYSWNDLQWSYAFVVSRATEEIPDRFDFTTRQALTTVPTSNKTRVNFNYDLTNRQFPKFAFLSGDPNDPSKFAWKNFETQTYDITEWDRIGELNLKLPLAITSSADFIQAGAKIRGKTKTRNDLHGRASTLNHQTIPNLSFFAESGEDINFYNNRYRIGPSGSPRVIGNWADTSSFNYSARYFGQNSITPNYDASELIVAGYGLMNLSSGPIKIVAGMRFEKTYIDYKGRQIVFNQAGAPIDTSKTKGTFEYYRFFPSLNAKYSLTDRFVLRAAASRAIFRPNYSDLVPFEAIDDQTNTIERGNSLLQPTVAWNLDASAEYYFIHSGILAGGLFYKSIDDFIYRRKFTQVGGIYDTWIITQRENGKAATIWGAELNWQQNFIGLPNPLNAFGIYLNYAYTHSAAYYAQRPHNKNTLPGQPNHVGNFALTYEKHGFSGRIAWNYSGAYVLTVSDSVKKDLDVFVDRHTQLDISASQILFTGLRTYLELNNLTNEPYREYVGSRRRLRQQEYYSWWGKLGVEYTW